MILQTGGSALGDISTRSNSNWSANFIASVNLKTLAQYFRLQDVPLAPNKIVYSVGIFLFYARLITSVASYCYDFII
jgi:hypothetical protein